MDSLWKLCSKTTLVLLLTLLCGVRGQRKSGPNFGTQIGTFRSYAHGVAGDVFAVDDDTLFIKGFRFDGEVPDTYFWAGSGPQPSAQGFVVPNEFGREEALKRYDGKDIAISLPPNKKIRDISWLSVWSRQQSSSFGDITLNAGFVAPQPRTLTRLGGGSGRGNIKSGDVVILDSKTILIPKFNYDGSLQETYFLVGTGNPSSQGTKIPDERGNVQNLRAYNSEDVRLVLPPNINVNDIDWLAVWSFVANENLAYLTIPQNLNVPPQIPGVTPGNTANIGGLSSSSQYSGQSGTQYGSGGSGTQYGSGGQYGGTGQYGGQNPGQYGSGQSGTGQYGSGTGQYGSGTGQYGSGTGQYGSGTGQYGSGTGQYGSGTGQYGSGTGQYGSGGYGGQGSSNTQYGSGVDNFTTCEEFLNGRVQVSWKLMGDSILIRMAGQINDNEYMAFGLSGSPTGSQMINGDVAVVYQDGFQTVVRDFYLDSKSKCVGTTGVCLDITLGGQDDLKTVAAVRQNGITVATYERRLNTGDRYDKPISTYGDNYVIAAIGPVLNNEINYHTQKTTENQRIDFSREGQRNCRRNLASQVTGGSYGGSGVGGGQYGGQYGSSGTGGSYGGSGTYGTGGTSYGGSGTGYGGTGGTYGTGSGGTYGTGSGGTYGTGSGGYGTGTGGTYGGSPYGSGTGTYGAQGGYGPGGSGVWFIQPIDRTFDIRCQIGPSGGDRGYSAITGKQSWGQAWWCNERLIPEIIVQRGQTYTFTVEGGDDPTNQAKYNPLYLTDSAVGGYSELSAEQRTRERIFAGVSTDFRGERRPSAAGRYCEWRARSFDSNINANTFEEYRQSLELNCDEGIPARLVWVPDDGTPDIVYYQSYSHKNFGWRIRVQGRAGFIRSAGHASVSISIVSSVAAVIVSVVTYFGMMRH